MKDGMSVLDRSARRSLAVEDNETLWNLHQALVTQMKKDGGNLGAKNELFEAKIELARGIMRSCRLCERRCGVNRLSGEKGFCGIGRTSYYFAESITYSEELPIIPSYTIYLNGCNFRCAYCNTREDNSWLPNSGEEVQIEKLSREILSRKDEISNVNFLGGEPTPHLLTIIYIARKLNGEVPIVWDSNMYCSVETIKLLGGVIDIYLGDFRYGNDECAMRYSGIEDYSRIVKRNLLLAERSGRLIVRYLLLPGHFECCFLPVVEWLKENLPRVEFSLFSEYVPCSEGEGFEEIGKRISAEEIERAKNVVEEKGFALVS